jgi:hypothetical protein
VALEELERDQSLLGREYDLELERWFRKRFGWLCALYGTWQVLFAAPVLLVLVGAHAGAFGPKAEWPEDVRNLVDAFGGPAVWVGMVSITAMLGIALWYGIVKRKRVETRADAVREASWMILSLGIVQAGFEAVVAARGGDFSPLTSLFFWHFTACLILPWTWRESLRPMLPLILLYAVIDVVLRPASTELVIQASGGIPNPAAIANPGGFPGTNTIGPAAAPTAPMEPLSSAEWWTRAIVRTLALPVILAPGSLIAYWRLTRHRRRYRSRRAGEGFLALRRELRQARLIHESLFPHQDSKSRIPFTFKFVPASEIGGDFCDTVVSSDGSRSVIIVDVFGHGLAAALAVNRLSGELERLGAEIEGAPPGEVLKALDRYVRAALAKHSVFATAIAARVNPADGTLQWANAGHPDGLLRHADGTVEHLTSTAMVLGAGDPFEAHEVQRSSPFAHGDALVLFTDGIIEACDPRGDQFGLARVRAALTRAEAPPSWPEYIVRMAREHARGVPGDDMLVVEVRAPAPAPVERVPESPALAATA